MAPARHLQINQETLDRRDQSDEGPRVRWMEAEPVWISPRLRVNGRVTVRSQATAVEDQSQAKRELVKGLRRHHQDCLLQDMVENCGRFARCTWASVERPCACDVQSEVVCDDKKAGATPRLKGSRHPRSRARPFTVGPAAAERSFDKALFASGVDANLGMQ